MPRTPRLLTALLVAAAPSTSAAFPQEAPRQERARESRATALAVLRSLVPDLWGSLVSVWGREGCSADPYGGHCISNPAKPAGSVPATTALR
jgi:hypothetical protein